MNFKAAPSIKGKLQFVERQLFFRVAAPVCRLLSRWASVGSERRLTEEMRMGLRSIEPALAVDGLRIVEPCSLVKPVVIFTNSACEEDGVTVGGIIFVPGLQPEAFGAKLIKKARLALINNVGQHRVIGQAEILPVLGQGYMGTSLQ